MMISRKNLFRANLLVPNRLSLSLLKIQLLMFIISYLFNFSEIINFVFNEKALNNKTSE